MKTNVAGILSSTADQSRIPFVDYRQMALPPGKRLRPRWLREEGFCFVGCWEIMAWRRYCGIATTWDEKDYAFEHSQAFLDDVKKLGCNAVIVPYDCGHGEAVNEAEVQLTRRFIQRAHASGLKVGTYFRMDIVWIETLDAAERAELDGGLQADSAGHPNHPLGFATRGVCYHHPGVRARFLRHVRRAIVELQTDILHLDGMLVGHIESQGACRCLNCVAAFREFLVARYGRDRALATQRFGYPTLEQILPPTGPVPFDSGPVSPHWCEWVAFRCQSTARFLAETAALAQELNPEVMIEVNNALPAPRENAALLAGTDLIGLGQYTDASWSEDGYPPLLHADGKLVQRVRQFKLCRAAGTFTLTYMDQTDARQLRQNLAHTAAFNQGHIGCIGFPPHMNFSNRYNVHFDIKCDFMRWLNAHREFYRDAQSDAPIAVWRPRESLAISGRLAYAASMRLEQLLIETCRSFDFVFDESPAALARYDLVIVPNVECLSLDQIEGLIAHVHNGGRLFVGQDSALFDLWHRRRIENPWGALFGDASARNVVADATAALPSGVFADARSAVASDKVALATHGQGRAVYAPLVVDPLTQPSLALSDGCFNSGLDYTNWVVPERAAEFNRALDWLLYGRERIRVTGQRGLLAECLTQPVTGRTLVHLVNLCPEPQRNCCVTLSGRVEAQVLHPPTDTPPQWRATDAEGGTWIEFTLLDTYAVIVCR